MMPEPAAPAVPGCSHVTLLSTVHAHPGCVWTLTNPLCAEPFSSTCVGVTVNSHVCVADPARTNTVARRTATAAETGNFMTVLLSSRSAPLPSLLHGVRVDDVNSIERNGPDRGPEPVQVQPTNRVRAGRQQR